MIDIADLFQAARRFLLAQQGVTRDILDRHLVAPAPGHRPQTLAAVAKTLLTSAQNAQMSPNVIGKALSGVKGDISPLGDIFFSFEPRKMHSLVAGLNADQVFTLIRPLLLRVPERTGIWLRYCKTIISAAAYLSRFDDVQAFYIFIEGYETSDEKRYDLPAVLADEIEGIGYALACDFMLSLGYASFGKPDVHVKNILSDMGLLMTGNISSRKADMESMYLLDCAARAAGTTVYAVDKLLWLIGSGDFYLAQPRFGIGRKRVEFREWVAAHV